VIPIERLFETHLNVANLDAAMAFYGGTLGLPLARVFPERRVAFYWLGAPGHTMLGIWETGTSPNRSSLHLAFHVPLDAMRGAANALRAAGIAPLDFSGAPAVEPVVLAWMPAVSLYFRDPDGNLLEFLTMLNEPPQPERGVVPWSAWR
jgi:lactoylglutathione lyase